MPPNGGRTGATWPCRACRIRLFTSQAPAAIAGKSIVRFSSHVLLDKVRREFATPIVRWQFGVGGVGFEPLIFNGSPQVDGDRGFP